MFFFSIPILCLDKIIKYGMLAHLDGFQLSSMDCTAFIPREAYKDVHSYHMSIIRSMKMSPHCEFVIINNTHGHIPNLQDILHKTG